MQYSAGYHFSWLLAFFSFVLLAGLRYKIGGDTIAYMNWYDDGVPTLSKMSLFNTSDANETQFDYLWVAFCSFCGLFSTDYFFMQFVHALVINSVYFYFIYKSTNYRFTALLIYFCLGFLYFNTEIMRESLAIAIFLLSISSFYRRKWIHYYIFSIIAFLFHSSALLLFFLPFISKIKVNKFFFYSIFILIPLIGVIWNLFQENIKLLFIFSNIESKAEAYFNDEYVPNINGIILMIFIYVIIPLLLTFLSNKTDRKDSPFIWLYIVFGILTVFNGVIFTRFQNYLFFPFIVWLADICFEIQIDYRPTLLGKKKLIILLIFMFFAGKHYTYFKEDDPGVYFYQRYLPYHSIITKQEVPFR
jgi:hypothetical protein